MSIAFAQTPFTIRRHQKLCSLPFSRNRLQILNFSSSSHLNERRRASRWKIRVFSSGERVDRRPQREVSGELTLDSFLSMAEVLIIIPPAIYSIGGVVDMLVPGAIKPFHYSLGSTTFVWQFFLLVGSVVIGSLIRHRQWRRISRESENGVGVDLLARIEKIEEDLRSSTTNVRVLSRQLEKLGIRFRVTRKALKEPITEAAALAQKNSEATRALALQKDILEKELGEVQKVLLATQEQQKKQLELILAIAKASRLMEGKRDTSLATEHGTLDSKNPILDKKDIKQMEI